MSIKMIVDTENYCSHSDYSNPVILYPPFKDFFLKEKKWEERLTLIETLSKTTYVFTSRVSFQEISGVFYVKAKNQEAIQKELYPQLIKNLSPLFLKDTALNNPIPLNTITSISIHCIACLDDVVQAQYREEECLHSLSRNFMTTFSKPQWTELLKKRPAFFPKDQYTIMTVNQQQFIFTEEDSYSLNIKNMEITRPPYKERFSIDLNFLNTVELRCSFCTKGFFRKMQIVKLILQNTTQLLTDLVNLIMQYANDKAAFFSLK